MCYIIQPVPLSGSMPDPVATCASEGAAADILDLCDPDENTPLVQLIREDEETGEKTVVKTLFAAGKTWYNGSNTAKEPTTMKTRQEIGDVIRAARIRNDMTQQELGERLGYAGESAGVSVRRWETAKAAIPIEKYRPLAALLDLTLDDLIP